MPRSSGKSRRNRAAPPLPFPGRAAAWNAAAQIRGRFGSWVPVLQRGTHAPRCARSTTSRSRERFAPGHDDFFRPVPVSLPLISCETRRGGGRSMSAMPGMLWGAQPSARRGIYAFRPVWADRGRAGTSAARNRHGAGDPFPRPVPPVADPCPPLAPHHFQGLSATEVALR